jgi:lipopolysaccharide transport system permease protein
MTDEFFIVEQERPASAPSIDARDRLHDEWGGDVHLIAPPQMSDFWHSIRSLPFYLPLFKVLVWRAVSLRYAQSYFGLVWVVAQPIATTLVVFLMFGIIRADTSDGSHPGLFLFAGIMSWQFFARGLQEANNSLLSHAGILTKIFLPKIMLPFAVIVASWFDTLIMIVLLLLACTLFGSPLSPRAFLLPLFLTIISFASLSVGLGLAPINALFRDIGVVLPIVLQFGMYITPVLYATKFIPGSWNSIYHLNPMTTLVEGVRWAILPESPLPDLRFLAINIATIVVCFLLSVFVFQRLESTVTDRI